MRACWLPERPDGRVAFGKLLARLDSLGIDSIPSPARQKDGVDGSGIIVELRSPARYRAYFYRHQRPRARASARPPACDLPSRTQAVLLSHAPNLAVISMRDKAKQVQRAEENAAPATSDGRPPYADPLPAPDVATPDDTARPELPPRHMIDDPERPENNTADLHKR